MADIIPDINNRLDDHDARLSALEGKKTTAGAAPSLDEAEAEAKQAEADLAKAEADAANKYNTTH